MTVIRPPPPPPMTTRESLAENVQTLMIRAAAVEAQQREMGEEIEKLRAQAKVLEEEREKLRAQVKVLEDERKWWRRWHLKWGPFFRAWRDGTPVPSH